MAMTPDPTPATVLQGYRKAVRAFLVTLVAALLVVWPAEGGFGAITGLQWLGVAAALVGVPTVVALTTNDPPKE